MDGMIIIEALKTMVSQAVKIGLIKGYGGDS